MTDEQKPEADTPAQEELELNEGPDTGADAAEASAGNLASSDGELDEEAEPDAKPRPPAKLERLQKILAQAGIASRRRGEELIEQGRVQVNGKIVTTLGTKADAGRDHIRVDGKLLQGAERLRYFVLNKPKGFVTTVKDPEGRPTVMQFFEKMRERLYPVGRLDYMSEGLLLVTNDGELANKLTKAASGVEKTYLVKVSGQPTEAELDILRGGVTIERGKPGSGQVRTSPARIRQVRQGDNPWYEVVLIEGRNRELRKMFEEIGHFVEKIRRVGYGPLVLDQEPGNLRELEPEELDALRKTADGKAKTPKAKDIRRRNTLDKLLPTLPPKPSRHRPPAAAFDRKESERPRDRRAGTRCRVSFDRRLDSARDGPRDRSEKDLDQPVDVRIRERENLSRLDSKGNDQARQSLGLRRDRQDLAAGDPVRLCRGRVSQHGKRTIGLQGAFRLVLRERSERAGIAGNLDLLGGKLSGAKGSFGTRPPAPNRTGGYERGAHKRPTPPRREAPAAEDFAAPKPSQLRIDPIEAEQPRAARPRSGRPPYRPSGTGRPSNAGAGSGRTSGGRPTPQRAQFERPQFNRPKFDRGSGDRPSFDRAAGNRPCGGPGRSGAGGYGHGRPARAEGGLARPFTSSTGKPRAGGPRPSSKRSGPGDRPYRTDGAGTRSGSRPPGKAAWKPKPDAVGKR